MKNIAIITARGGSKRIPRKNIKDFCGKPIIAYSIESALKSNLFEEVMVSTEDEEIASIAIKYGARVPFRRSEKAADDYATTADVIKEVILEYQKRNIVFENLCCIYPTAPFITADKLVKCMQIFIDKDVDSLVPIVKFSYPPQRCFVMDNEQKISYKWKENTNKRSQDLEQLYHDAGQFYFCKINKFLSNQYLISDNSYGYIVDEMEVQDIDNLDDWNIAEMKYKIMRD